MSALLLGLVALAPWLALVPIGGAAGVLARALLMIAALHGAGLVVAHLARRPRVHPLLAVQWGIALLVGLSGLALLAGRFGFVTQTLLVCGAAAVHTALIGLRFASYRERIAAVRVGWIAVPAGLLVLVGGLQVLGAAGDLGAHPVDDDGHVLAQLQRLRDTGALGDPIGYARASQLGGQLALGALATVPGDVHLVRGVEALAFVLALALALAQLRTRDAAAGLWATLLVIAGSALGFVADDPAACWTAVGLLVALHAMLTDDEPRALVPIGLVAGALITLRHELAPLGIAAIVAAWWPVRRERRGLVVIGAALAIVVPYLLARSSLSGELRALLLPAKGLGPRLAIAAGILAAGLPLALGLVRDRRVRWLALGAVVVAAGIAGQLTGPRPYALRFLWPLAFAAGLIVATELARARALVASVMIATLLVIVLVHDGRTRGGRARWTRRYLDLAANLEYLRHAGDRAPVAGGYDAVLRDLPRGATVAVWVTRPERLDHAAHRIVDLRTPRAARLRIHRTEPHASRLERLLVASGARFLLVERDDRHAQRVRASLHVRFACPSPLLPGCADDLEALALRYPVVAEREGLVLLRLR